MAISFDGRWNTVGRAVTYCATSPALCVLEKLVPVEDPALLSDLVMIKYDVPDTANIETIEVDKLPEDWRRRSGWTQQRGDAWHRSRSTLLLKVPSAIVPLKGSPDVNVLINHNHPGAADIKIACRSSTEQAHARDQRRHFASSPPNIGVKHGKRVSVARCLSVSGVAAATGFSKRDSRFLKTDDRCGVAARLRFARKKATIMRHWGDRLPATDMIVEDGCALPAKKRVPDCARAKYATVPAD